MDFLADINTEGLQQLIIAFMQALSNFNIKDMGGYFNSLAQLLTIVAPIWNPIWERVWEWLVSHFGA